MKKPVVYLLALMPLFASPAALYAGGGKQCAYDRSGMTCPKSGEEYQCPLVGKFMQKAEFFLSNQKELGLSEEQVTQIKTLKAEEKKAYIRAMADMQVFHIDMESKMSEPKVDVAAINAMIDSGTTAWTRAAKATVARYAQLKSVLSADQMAKAKEIWRSRR